MTMTNTGDPDFVSGWFLAAQNKPLPETANKKMKEGYESGKRTAEAEKDINDWPDRVNREQAI